MITLMDSYLLASLTERLFIAPINIVRENLEISLLQELAQSPLSQKLIFYGGTALRLAYGSPRYSEDLDFLMTKEIRVSDLESLLQKVMPTPEGLLELVEVKEKRHTLFALIRARHPDLKHPFNVKLEIAKRKNGIESAVLPLNTGISPLKPLIRVAALKSLDQLKVKAIKGRQDPKDWFDLWYVRQLLKSSESPRFKFPFNKKEFGRELRRFLPASQFSLIEQVIRFYENA